MMFSKLSRKLIRLRRRNGDTDTALFVFAGIGLVFIIWLAVKIAPGIDKGFFKTMILLSTIWEKPFQFKYCDKTIPAVLVSIAGYVFCAYLFYETKIKGFRRGEEYGSAKWADMQELHRLYADTEYPTHNIILTQNVWMATDIKRQWEYDANLHNVSIGGSGASKTTSMVVPNLLQMQGSYLVLDPAGEVIRGCGHVLKKNGYDVRVLNLVDTDRSMGFNPFLYLHSYQDVLRMVNMFVKATQEVGARQGEQIWTDAMKALMLAICYYLYDFAPPEDQNFDMVQRLVSQLSSDPKVSGPTDILFEQLENDDPDHVAVRMYRTYTGGADKSRQSVVFTMQSRLYQFILPGISALCQTTEDELGLETLPERKTVIFVIVETQGESPLQFFVSLLYQQMFDIIYRYGILKVPFHFLMDEFANVPVPDGFPEIVSTIRKYGAYISIILQSVSQLQSKYKDDWKGIIGNCDSLLYLGGNDRETFKYISEQLGKETIFINTYGKQSGRGGSSTNLQQKERDLMSENEVRKMSKKHCILLLRGEDPVYDRKYKLKKHPNFKECAFHNKKGTEYIIPNYAEQKRAYQLRYMIDGAAVRLDLNEDQIRALPPLRFDNVDDADIEFVA